MKVFITGVAGFIGASLAKLLAAQGHSVIGIDNLNDYYEVSLKKDRLFFLEKFDNIEFKQLDLVDYENLLALFEKSDFDVVVNLAAQAGVRHSFKEPKAYIHSNLIGFFNILECCRVVKPQHLVYASSSSVYGGTQEKPSSENLKIDKPLSLYAASKKANELMAYSYAHLFKIRSTGLRFFSVYGPWGRPDMALFKFVKNIYEDKTIQVYNHGKMFRDFTYIDDIVNGIYKVMAIPAPHSLEADDIAKVYNIGRGAPVNLMDFIRAIEKEIGKKAMIEYCPMQEGDVVGSHSDISMLSNEIGYTPKVGIDEGIQNFVRWYKEYYCLEV